MWLVSHQLYTRTLLTFKAEHLTITSTASPSFGTNSAAFAVLVTPLPYPSAQHNKHTAGSHSFFFFDSGVIRKLSFSEKLF